MQCGIAAGAKRGKNTACHVSMRMADKLTIRFSSAILGAMDSETLEGESRPMEKQEIVKEDGRTLIYYAFPSLDPPAAAAMEADRKSEDAHV
jgi:hypothetical protein